MFNFVKNFFMRRTLAQQASQRNVYITSLQKAKNIGIICDITDEDSYKRVFSVFSKLQNSGRNVWLMGYIDDDAVPFYCLQQLAADYFCNKDLNWYGKPLKVQIEDFIAKDFDMIIDLTKKSFPIFRYILTLSNAHLLIGSAKETADLYDIYIEGENLDSHESLVEQIALYTNKLVGGTNEE